MKLQPTKEPTRILLSEAARKHLEATGEDVFVVTAMNKSEERTGRWVFYLVPTIYSRANSAARVAMGISTERKKTKTDTASVLPPAPAQAADIPPGDMARN